MPIASQRGSRMNADSSTDIALVSDMSAVFHSYAVIFLALWNR